MSDLSVLFIVFVRYILPRLLKSTTKTIVAFAAFANLNQQNLSDLLGQELQFSAVHLNKTVLVRSKLGVNH